MDATPIFGDLVEFVMEHRKDKVFTDMNKMQVASKLYKYTQINSLYYAVSEGKITGMILADIDFDNKILFVTENLALTLLNMRNFARKAAIEYPGFKIDGLRHDKPITYKMDNLLKKLKV